MGQAVSKKENRKAQAVRLAEQYRPIMVIASDLGVSRTTVYRWLEEHRAELPPRTQLTRERLHLAIAGADGIDELLRVLSVARHFEDANPTYCDVALPDLTTIAGRQTALQVIGDMTLAGTLPPARATVLLATVKEASDLDELASELARLEVIEASLIPGPPGPVGETGPPGPPGPAG